MRIIRLFFTNTWIFLILFFACQPKKISNQGAIDSMTSQDQSNNATLAKSDTSEYPIDSDCIRGIAEPILKKDFYPNSIFKLNADSITAIETVYLKNGDKLIIENDGCEYYVLAFRFETSRFQGDTTDILFWLDKGHKLLTEVEQGINSSMATDGILGIKTFLDSKKSIVLGEQITFNDSEIRFFGLVRRVQKMTDNKYGIEISFAVGPL